MRKLIVMARITMLLLLLAIQLAGCDEGLKTDASSSLRTPIPLPPTRVVDARVPRLPTWTPKEPGATPQPGALMEPLSGRVKQGQAYDFPLYTHCGIDQHVDFDGSFWDASDLSLREFGNPPPGIGNPGQLGTMTLVDENRARFEYEGGSFEFVRHNGPKLIRICY